MLAHPEKAAARGAFDAGPVPLASDHMGQIAFGDGMDAGMFTQVDADANRVAVVTQKGQLLGKGADPVGWRVHPNRIPLRDPDELMGPGVEDR
jgi:hypothetical protein